MEGDKRVGDYVAVYDYKDIMRLLKIGKNQAYSLMKSEMFPVIHLGKSYKVSKVVFDKWLAGEYSQP